MDKLTIVIFVLIGILLLAVVWLVFMFFGLSNYTREELENLKSKIRDINFQVSNEKNVHVSHTVGRDDNLRADVQGLAERIIVLEKMFCQIRENEGKNGIKVVEPNEKHQQPEQMLKSNEHEKPQNMVKFAKNQGGGCLKECAEKDSHYKLFNVTDSDADFSLCANFDMVKSAPNDYLDGAAEASGDRISASSIKTKEPGHVIKESGKWKVTRTTKVEFK